MCHRTDALVISPASRPPVARRHGREYKIPRREQATPRVPSVSPGAPARGQVTGRSVARLARPWSGVHAAHAIAAPLILRALAGASDERGARFAREDASWNYPRAPRRHRRGTAERRRFRRRAGVVASDRRPPTSSCPVTPTVVVGERGPQDRRERLIAKRRARRCVRFLYSAFKILGVAACVYTSLLNVAFVYIRRHDLARESSLTDPPPGAVGTRTEQVHLRKHGTPYLSPCIPVLREPCLPFLLSPFFSRTGLVAPPPS